MVNLDFHSESVWQGLALHRFNIHKEEVKRVLKSIVDEVYRIGYDRGVADNYNNLIEENYDMSSMLPAESVSDGMSQD